MFSSSYDHYLAYGSTDQETMRSLRDVYDGLVVPGTVAAYQKQGTGGFVLAMSAEPTRKPYVIDPRTPLFQQRLSEPKRSHHMLAEALGDPRLVSTGNEPDPSEFDADRLRVLASHWVDFNLDYRTEANEKFEKYARLLGETVVDPTTPEAILAPYFVTRQSNDTWHAHTQRLLTFTREAASARGYEKVLPVLATEEPGDLSSVLDASDDERVVVWSSGIDEVRSDASVLAEYADSIHRGARSGTALFALYGGFFAVLLATLGLRGCSHGIGFSEHRHWIELPRSGGPGQRYYLPLFHRYVDQDTAAALYTIERTLAICTCEICDGRPPLLLDYHELMQHSVVCRAREIASWTRLSFPDALQRLRNEAARASGLLQEHEERIRRRVGPRQLHLADPLLRWVDALESVGLTDAPF